MMSEQEIRLRLVSLRELLNIYSSADDSDFRDRVLIRIQVLEGVLNAEYKADFPE